MMRGSKVLVTLPPLLGAPPRVPPSAAGGQVKVGVIESVIHLGAELNLEPFKRSIEVLVQRKIRGVVRRGSTRVAAIVAEWAQQSSAGVLGSRQASAPQ